MELLGKNLTKYVQDIYIENYETLMKVNSKMNEEIGCFLGLNDSILFIRNKLSPI